MNKRYKLIQNGLGQYGVLDTYTGKPTNLKYNRARCSSEWTGDRTEAEQAMMKFEGWERQRIKQDTWKLVE
jgi:hypothetical protein